MTNPRAFLSANPMTFNELLDLFEAFLTASYNIITDATRTLHDDFEGGSLRNNDDLASIFGVAVTGGDMARRLQQIRAERNAGSDVTITLTRIDAVSLECTLVETDHLLSAAGCVFEHLQKRDTDDAGASAVMALAERALFNAYEIEGARLRKFIDQLRSAQKDIPTKQEKVA